MRKAFFALFVAAFSVVAQAQFRTPESEAKTFLAQIIAEQPDEQLKRDITKWRSAGRLIFALDPAVISLGAQSAINKDTGDTAGYAALLIHPSWPTMRFAADSKESQGIKYLQLYHEYVHLLDHFEGRYRLDAFVKGNDYKTSAEFIWNAERSAEESMLRYARKHNLMGSYMRFRPIKVRVNEQLAFLDMFYEYLNQYPDKQFYLSFWSPMYHKERTRLLTSLSFQQ